MVAVLLVADHFIDERRGFVAQCVVCCWIDAKFLLHLAMLNIVAGWLRF